jgi:hypothetical protein
VLFRSKTEPYQEPVEEWEEDEAAEDYDTFMTGGAPTASYMGF